MIVSSQKKFNRIRIIVLIVFLIIFYTLKDNPAIDMSLMTSDGDSMSFIIALFIILIVLFILLRILYFIIFLLVPNHKLNILDSDNLEREHVNDFTFNKSDISEIIISNDDFQIYLTLKLKDSSERKFVPVIYSYFITSLSNKAIKYFMDQSDRLFHDIPITFEKEFPKYKSK